MPPTTNNEQRIHSLLQQCQRQFLQLQQQQHTPHAVAAALGRALAEACHQATTTTTELREQVLETLARNDLHPSIAHAFFENSTSSSFLATWIVALESSHCFEACARAYAQYVVDDDDDDESSSLMTTYQRFTQSASRAAFVRHVFPLLVRHTTRIPHVLSPLVVVTFVSHSWQEQSSFLQQLWRALWSVWCSETITCDEKILLLEWLTRCVRVILLASDKDMELLQSWVVELILLAQALVEQDDDKTRVSLVPWSDTLLCDIVPLLIVQVKRSSPVTSLLKPVYDALVDWLTLLGDSSDTPLEPFSLLQWSTLLQMTLPKEERQLLLQLLLCWSTPRRLTVSLPFVRSLLEGLSCIWIHDPDCQLLAAQLQQALCTNPSGPVTKSSSIGALLLEDDHSLLGRMVSSFEFSTDSRELSFEQQMTLLLVAVSHLSVLSSQSDWYTFLKRLIGAYPYLGITFLPIHLQLVQNAAIQCDGDGLLRYLEFLAGPLVMDPHCAQQVWTFFGSQWIQDGAYMNLRIAIVRLYPRICQTNKRMYRRVIDSLGNLLHEKDPEIRLAVAATISDLAKDDCIRDVSDVIGWIQQLLTEEGNAPVYSLIKHYAIRSLHFLTLNQELEFALVIKVLNKKLCSVTDHEKVIELPVPVLEALCLLLGDGEVDEDGSDDVDSDVVGAQVRQSIDTLLYLGDALHKKNRSLEGKDNHITGSETCLFHIFESLNRYSVKTLEVDEDDIKRAAAATENEQENPQSTSSNSNRYLQLRELVLDGMESLRSRSGVNKAQPLTELARKLMAFEEDILGASYWQKRSSPRTGSRASRDQLRREQALRVALPSVSLLTSLPSTTPSTDRAIAALLASDGTQLTILRDNADASIENTDPLLLVFAVKGFHRITGLCLRATSNSPSSLFREVRDWNEVFISPDAMYLSLVSLAVSLAEGTPSDEGLRTEIGAVAEEIFSSFQGNEFQDESIGKICLGLCGVVYVYLGEFPKVVEILDLLEHSVRGYGGQQDFGAYFGVSIIAQTVATVARSEQPTLSDVDISRVTVKATSFIVEELLSCFEDGGSVTTSLLACLKIGKATIDLVQSLERLGTNSRSLLMTKNVVARCLFISASICLPSLSVSDGNLLLAVLRLIESFEWAGGKGIALASVLQQCEISKLVTKTELELIHNEYASIFQRRIDRDDDSDIESDGLDDIFYAVNGMSTATTPRFARRLLVGNRELFDDEGCATSLIACVLSICSIPCLGITSFFEVPRVYSRSTEADVKDITEIVLSAAKLGDGSKYSSVGTVMLGMLSSAQTEVLLKESPSILKSNSTNASNKKVTNESVFDFGSLPRPQLGTLSEGIFSLLERCYLVVDDKECIALQSSLAALESISLPSKFAKCVMRKHLQTIRWGGEAVVRLLCSQIHGRRSVLQDGRDFVDLAIQISACLPDEWRSTVVEKSARDTYVRELYKVFPKVSNIALGQSIRNVWKLCNNPGIGSRTMTALFLKSIERLLVGSALSSKAKQIIYDFLCHECYASIISYSLHEALLDNEDCGSLLTSFIQCAQLVPFAVFQSSTILSLPTSEESGSMLQESFRAYVILKLLSVNGCFPSSNRQDLLKHYQSWLIHCLALVDSMESVEIDCLRCLHYCFGALTSEQSSRSKHEILLSIMESMLLATSCAFSASLELLGMLLASWCHALGIRPASLSHLLTINDPGIEFLTPHDRRIVYEALVRDLPTNLSLFVENENRAQFSNLLHRLHLHVHKIAPETESQTILCAIFSCNVVREKDGSYLLEATKFVLKQAAYQEAFDCSFDQ